MDLVVYHQPHKPRPLSTMIPRYLPVAPRMRQMCPFAIDIQAVHSVDINIIGSLSHVNNQLLCLEKEEKKLT